MPVFWHPTDKYYQYQIDGTVQILSAHALYCSSGFCYPYDFTGSSQRFNVSFDDGMSANRVTSVRMSYIYILTSKDSEIDIFQLTNDIKIAPTAKKRVTIECNTIVGLSVKGGCAVRFTDYSFLYIGGYKAVEVEIINYSYKQLPGTLNHKREYFGCDVVVIDGVETVLVAGGKDSEASRTSEYYDRNDNSWKLTTGGLIYPR